MAFPSVYEMTNPLTTVRKQHFWEYFSGSTIISNGVEWQNMTDGQSASANQLIKSGTSWTADATGTRTFSSSEGAEIEFTVSQSATDSFCGFDISTNTDSYNMDYALYCGGGGTINIYANGSQVSATGVSYTSADRLGVRMDSSGTVTFLKNGAVFYTSSTTASGTYRVNATIYTSGVSLNVNMNSRWAITNFGGGAGATAMADEVNGGVKLTTSGNRSALQFNNKRQFSNTGSEIIWVVKQAGSGANGAVGLASNSNGYFNSGVHVDFPTSGNSNFYTLNDAGAGSYTSTGKNVSESFSYHTYKMTCSASSQTCTIDGDLSSTVTRDNNQDPDEKMQPVALAYNSSTTLHLQYCEAYNT